MSLDLNTAISIAAAIGAITAAIVGVMMYRHANRKYETVIRRQNLEKEIMNGESVTIFDIQTEGQFLNLMLDIRGNPSDERKILLRYILDDGDPVVYSLRELIDSGVAQALPPSTNVLKAVVNFAPNYTFHKHGQLILDNQTNQAFRAMWHATARQLK